MSGVPRGSLTKRPISLGSVVIPPGVVQTAYANGGSTAFLEKLLVREKRCLTLFFRLYPSFLFYPTLLFLFHPFCFTPCIFLFHPFCFTQLLSRFPLSFLLW